MGISGANGFGPALRGADVEDAGENETMRETDGETGHSDVDARNSESNQLIDVGTCAGELKQRVDITEIMVDGVCITEGQYQHASSVSHGTRKCHQVGTKHKARTHFRGHNNVIQKCITEATVRP